MIVFDILLVLAIVLWGAFGIEATFGGSNKLDRGDIVFLKRLFVFHLVISLIFSAYVMKTGGDAKAYWFISSRFGLNAEWLSYYKIGTYFMLFLTYPLVKYLEISFYVGGLFFATIGYLSFIYVYIIVRKFIDKPVVIYSIYVFPFILFLPNFHFWTGGIGKDALTTFTILAFYYSLFDLKRNWILGGTALILAYHIRPHIVIFLLASTLIAIIIDGKMKTSWKIALGAMMIILVFILFDKVISFLKLEDVSSESISQFSETKASNLSKGSGSSVDIANYPLPLKIFTFLYRPLFVDASGPLGIISSVENCILLFMTFITLRLKPIKSFKVAPMPIKSLTVFFLITTVGFSLTLGNLGIMLRQKNASILCLMIFIFWCVGYHRHLKTKLPVHQ